MESIKNKIQHLNQLVLEGKAMEAFDLYYDDDVIMQENQMPKMQIRPYRICLPLPSIKAFSRQQTIKLT